MFEALFIQHDKLPQILLDEIIKVKTVHWPYSYSEQCEWIKNNLRNSDIHALLFERQRVVAYLNLVKIEIEIDSTKLIGFGVGNVCALKKGRGWGRELMIKVNQYLIENEKIGLLFCKEKLVRFYTKSEWALVKDQQLAISNLDLQILAFIYNAPDNFNQLKYDGFLF